MPGASSGVPMNSIPASSSARFNADTLAFVLAGTPSSLSIRLIVLVLTLDAFDRPATLHRKACLADRSCAPVILDIRNS